MQELLKAAECSLHRRSRAVLQGPQQDSARALQRTSCSNACASGKKTHADLHQQGGPAG